MANSDVSRVAGNIHALNSLNSLQSINRQLGIHQTRLATGKRINAPDGRPWGRVDSPRVDPTPARLHSRPRQDRPRRGARIDRQRLQRDDG